MSLNKLSRQNNKSKQQNYVGAIYMFGFQTTVNKVDGSQIGAHEVHVLSRSWAIHSLNLVSTSGMLMRVTERLPVSLSGYSAAVSLSKMLDPSQNGRRGAWI